VNFNNPESDPIIARPISSNITRYPVINEIVILKVLVSKEAQNNFDNYKPEIYYTDIISLFNATEENAAPDSSYLKNNPNEKYVTGKYIPSGQIKRLIKSPGDVTIEGRRGNSIRLGTNMTGFKTPWVSKNISPILVISNNPSITSGSTARFESLNDDGSTLMMMSGHNVSFQPASSNFSSYNTTVSIPQKNNVVVTDQEPKSKPEDSLKQEDEKPIPKDVPKPEPTPVSVEVPPSTQNLSEEDEEIMPEREDLLQIEIIYDDLPVSLGTAQAPEVNIEAAKEFAKSTVENAGGKIPEVKTTKSKFISQASGINRIIQTNLKNYSGTGFLEKLTKICNKYKIDVKDMLVIMAIESGTNPQRARLNKEGGIPQAVGIIQFTNAREYSVFENIKKQKRFSSLKNHADIADVLVINQPGKTSKYDFDQLDLVDFYLSGNSVLKNPKNGKVDRYGLYAAIFYPAIGNRGTIELADNELVGAYDAKKKKKSYEEQVKAAFATAQMNPAISKDCKDCPVQIITIRRFKDFIDSKFGNVSIK
jgi:hypothetical protein